MPDYRKMFDDKDHLYAFDLDGRERTLEIERVTAGLLKGEQGRESKKPMVSFVDEKKKLAINKTNGKTIAALYGTDTDKWSGELITIYPTTTDFGGKTVDCIRVRPERPRREGGTERRSSGNGSRQSKPDQHGAEESALAAKYLLERYKKCDSDELAAIKEERGKMWRDLTAADREIVGEAARAAKARIDAAAKASDPDGDIAVGGDPPIGDAEAAAIRRSEAEAARGG